MEKRYQVFISSTYADLKDERSKVIQTIMELDCMPAGMEIFPAIDEEQFNFIKRIIDDCDYYALIIGGRYGSVSDDGISYTEMEFDYAIEKGIKVLAFVHSNPDEISFGKSEKDAELQQKLKHFKEKVSTNRLVKFWNTAEDLPGLVALSLSKTIKTYPAIGWIKANSVTNPELLKELNDQRKENQELKDKITILIHSQNVADKVENLADLDEHVNTSGWYRKPVSSVNDNSRWQFKISWKEIFGLLSPHLLDHPIDSIVKNKLGQLIFGKTGEPGHSAILNDEIYQTIKIHLKALGLTDLEIVDSSRGTEIHWVLTKKGESLMINLRSVKKGEIA